MATIPQEPGTPDTRSPGRYLWWLMRRQVGRIMLGALWGSLWMVGLAVAPYFVNRAIDDGLSANDTAALARWAGGFLLLGLCNAVIGTLRHRTMTFARLDAAYRTVRLVTRHAVRLGAALPKRVSSGEVVNIGMVDIARVAEVMTIAGPGFGACVAYLVVAALLLGISPPLGVLILVGVPTIVVLIGPLLARLHRRESEYREQQGALTARAGDIVAGLRVLRGIGGEELFAGRYRERSADLRDEGYRVGAVTSWIRALEVGLPGLFLAVVVWMAARMAAAGAITLGETVAVYGYAAVLVVPVAFLTESGSQIIAALVAARRVVAVLGIDPGTAGGGESVTGPDGPRDLHDPVTGLRVPAGRMTVIAAAGPADALALADRLGRYTDSPATLGGVRLADMDVGVVRRRILVADNDAFLFAGTVREVLAGAGDPGDARIAGAVEAAAAGDILAGLPAGLDTTLGTQARTLSGGQRQRLRLARALLAGPETLVLLDPTSAVDAHTEAAIADRLAHARAGLTTVVLSTSPLWLDRAQHVAYVSGNRTVAVGTHATLLDAQPAYRALVMRGVDDGERTPTEGTLR
jgi:ABC-type multidrug transport system fused ATPase/permease subunit